MFELKETFSQMVSHVLSSKELQVYQHRMQQHRGMMKATTSRKRVRVCVCVNSGTAAHKVSLISWQTAHWTAVRRLNPLLMKLRSNTSRQNGSLVWRVGW